MLKMILPVLNSQEDVRPFLVAHIQLDLQNIAKCSAQSTDDCMLLIHDVINRMKGGSTYMLRVLTSCFLANV